MRLGASILRCMARREKRQTGAVDETRAARDAVPTETLQRVSSAYCPAMVSSGSSLSRSLRRLCWSIRATAP